MPAKEKKRVRDLIEQLPDDQHKLDRYIEIAKDYDISQSYTQAFKTRNKTANAKFINIIKHPKGKVNHAHIMDLVISLVNAKSKRQSVKFVKR